eukprot:Lankesteria_metandrocarpae@DN5098_c0_g1_i2.p1
MGFALPAGRLLCGSIAVAVAAAFIILYFSMGFIGILDGERISTMRSHVAHHAHVVGVQHYDTVAPVSNGECPSVHTSADISKLLPRRRLEKVSGGHVPEMLSDNRPTMKVLFIVPRREYEIMMSRWYFHIYDAAKTIPHYITHAWGVGHFGYGRICSCVDYTNGRMMVQCPKKGSTHEQDDESEILGIDGYRKSKEAFMQLPEYSTNCVGLMTASFAEHIAVLFDAVSHPFDAIVYSWIAGSFQRESYFAGLDPNTALVMLEVDWHVRSLKQWRTTQPDVVLTSYIDNFEENFPLRDFVRSISYRDARRNFWFESYVQSAIQFLMPSESVMEGKASYKDTGPDVLFAYGRHSILPQCSQRWINHISTNDTSTLHSHRLQAITMIGRVDEHYPTRNIFAVMLKDNYSNIATLAKMRPHPGYTETTELTEQFNAKTQFQDYMRMLEHTKLCFIGGISTWSIRKYKEAMAAGCLVVGDVPADHYLAKYVVNVDIIPPGYFNFDEDLDVIAANEASSAQFGNLTNWWCANSTCDRTLEEERAQHNWIVSNPYAELGHRNYESYGRLLARKLIRILERYEEGGYNDLIVEARRVVLTEYSSQQLLTTYFDPAIAAWRRGERGWLRTPAYFQDSYKYRARHYFLLREWLLQQEGSDIVPELKNMTYGSLLQRASHRLRADTRAECIEAVADDASADDASCTRVCDDPSMDYFQGMGDFDIAFVKARNLYALLQPLDRYSHIHRMHMQTLY